MSQLDLAGVLERAQRAIARAKSLVSVPVVLHQHSREAFTIYLLIPWPHTAVGGAAGHHIQPGTGW